MLEDLDHEAVERLSINFIKTVCDESGFAVDQKYKTPQLSRTTNCQIVLVVAPSVIDKLARTTVPLAALDRADAAAYIL